MDMPLSLSGQRKLFLSPNDLHSLSMILNDIFTIENFVLKNDITIRLRSIHNSLNSMMDAMKYCRVKLQIELSDQQNKAKSTLSKGTTMKDMKMKYQPSLLITSFYLFIKTTRESLLFLTHSNSYSSKLQGQIAHIVSIVVSTPYILKHILMMQMMLKHNMKKINVNRIIFLYLNKIQFDYVSSNNILFAFVSNNHVD